MPLSRWIFLIALGVAGAVLFRTYGVEGIYVATPSMEPTLPVNTHYFVDKFIFNFRSPRRGEIVLLKSPVNDQKELIKRVIGLPGERIKIDKKKVYIDGQALAEPYVQHIRKDEELEGDTLNETAVPEDSYFVLGDNRDESSDSATWKDAQTGQRIYFVKRDQIKGRLMNVLE